MSQPENTYQPRNLSKAVDRFNRGRSTYQQALNAAEKGDLAEYEKSLLTAAPLIVGAVEWTLKIYLREACSGTKDFARLGKANFHTLLTLMEQYAQPPLLPETARALYDARDIRNAAEHDAAIPSKEELDQAMRTVRQVMLDYLPVEPAQLEQEPAGTEEENGEPDDWPDFVESIQPSRPLTGQERASLERQLANLRDNLRRIEERITEYVDPTEVPLTLLKNRDRVQQQIAELEPRLGPVATSGSPPPLRSNLTPSQRRRLERKIEALEVDIDRVTELLKGLRRDRDLENRFDERRRIEARIEDNQKLLDDYEAQLNELEAQLE